MELQTAIEILEYHQEWRLGKKEVMIHEPKKLTEALDIVLTEVSGSTFTVDDMKKAFMAGADKKYWTKIYLTGVVSGQDYVLEPIFEKWFEYYR